MDCNAILALPGLIRLFGAKHAHHGLLGFAHQTTLFGMISSRDAFLLSKVRLAIVCALKSDGEKEFTPLRESLGLTGGNLITHLRVLRRGGIVKFNNKRGHTAYALTTAGRTRIQQFAKVMRLIADSMEGT